ncbi:Matrix metalloproteinase-16 [Eumeta japonica]|uniref:Matrix metalloproteinase-16 n=1 Tax=Eumeta variegata TaxID=151549 RepID=A0A4C1YRZ3_EUMVA|nr:Matrix metalloproteinase-16 [Eumeta japonica]
MSSVFVNGSRFAEPNSCDRPIVNKTLKSHFGIILMTTRLAGPKEVPKIGDVNQLPFIDGLNLFEMEYIRTNLVVMVAMDVAYALNEVEKESLIVQGFEKVKVSRVLTIHEAQNLTYEGTIIGLTTAKQKLHDSTPHAVVAITCHTVSCIYYTDDGGDVIDRFVNRALATTDKKVYEKNTKMAVPNKDRKVMDVLEDRQDGFLDLYKTTSYPLNVILPAPTAKAKAGGTVPSDMVELGDGCIIVVLVSWCHGKHYLEKFGYLKVGRPEMANLVHGDSVQELEDDFRIAIKTLQEFGGIEVTGEIDEATKELLKKKRCGRPDREVDLEDGHRKKRFAVQGEKWKHTNLSWSPPLVLVPLTGNKTGSAISRRVYESPAPELRGGSHHRAVRTTGNVTVYVNRQVSHTT